jgi:2-keto-3-deoxy-L-rhamnonate aldolase RhmA
MVPHVRTVAESCRYPPHGHRSASGSGPALGYAARSQGEINDGSDVGYILSAGRADVKRLREVGCC